MASTRLTRTMGTPTLGTKFTYSCWVKRGALGTPSTMASMWIDGNNHIVLRFDLQDNLNFYAYVGSSSLLELETNAVFRDTSAFYNIVVKVDTTQLTASDRCKLYVNGQEQTSLSTATYPSQNATFSPNASGTPHYVGGRGDSTAYFGGLISYFAFVDGAAYDASYFGETDSSSGIWKIKTSPSVTYGNNGFFLKMDTATPGADSSGKNNTFSPSGSPTLAQDNASNNFTTLNPLARYYSDTSSLSNGNNTYSITSYTFNARSTIAMPSGKWYWEVKQSADNCRLGVCTSGFNPNIDTDDAGAYYGGSTGFGGVYIMNTGPSTNWQITNNNTSKNVTTYTNGVATGANTILSVAVDVDAGKLWVGVNGTWLYSGDPAAGSGEQIAFTNSSPDPLQAFIGFNSVNARVAQCNFGNGFFGVTAVTTSPAKTDGAGHGKFQYTVPTGFYTLNTKNLNTYG